MAENKHGVISEEVQIIGGVVGLLLAGIGIPCVSTGLQMIETAVLARPVGKPPNADFLVCGKWILGVGLVALVIGLTLFFLMLVVLVRNWVARRAEDAAARKEQPREIAESVTEHLEAEKRAAAVRTLRFLVAQSRELPRRSEELSGEAFEQWWHTRYEPWSNALWAVLNENWPERAAEYLSLVGVASDVSSDAAKDEARADIQAVTSLAESVLRHEEAT